LRAAAIMTALYHHCWKNSQKNLLQPPRMPKKLLQNCQTSSKVAKEQAPKLPNNLL